MPPYPRDLPTPAQVPTPQHCNRTYWDLLVLRNGIVHTGAPFKFYVHSLRLYGPIVPVKFDHVNEKYNALNTQ